MLDRMIEKAREQEVFSHGDTPTLVIQKRFASRVLYECNEPKAAKGDQTSSDGR